MRLREGEIELTRVELLEGFFRESADLAGGLRAGPSQGDVGRLIAADVGGPDAPDAPVVACWEGRIAAVGPRDAVEAAIEADGLPLGRFARIDARGGSITPGLVDLADPGQGSRSR